MAVLSRLVRDCRRDTEATVLPVQTFGTPMLRSCSVMASRLPELRGEYFYGASFFSIGLCIALWIRAKIVGEDERGNAERRAIS